MLLFVLFAGCGEPADDSLWRYVDAEGRTVYVNGEDRIPPDRRATAVNVVGRSDRPGDDAQDVYLYAGPGGRKAYANGLDRVPVQKRDTAVKVDLSRATVNPELGADLDDALEDEWDRLVASDPCVRARDAAGAGTLRALLRDHGYLFVIGGAVLLLVVLTPWAMRRFDPPVWGRVLVVAIPVLAFVGLFAAAIVETRRTLHGARAIADACEPSALAGAPDLAARLGLVDRLRTTIKAADIEGTPRSTTRGR